MEDPGSRLQEVAEASRLTEYSMALPLAASVRNSMTSVIEESRMKQSE